MMSFRLIFSLYVRINEIRMYFWLLLLHFKTGLLKAIAPAHEIILHVHVFIKHLHVQVLARQLGEDDLSSKEKVANLKRHYFTTKLCSSMTNRV